MNNCTNIFLNVYKMSKNGYERTTVVIKMKQNIAIDARELAFSNNILM